MANIEFRIDNELIDYKDDASFPLVLSKQVIDFKNIEQRKGESSFTIIIPLTSNNSTIFKRIENLDKANKFKKVTNYEYTLDVNGNRISKGIFYLTRVTEKGYEGVLLTKSISWWQLLNGKNLRDLQLENFDFNNTLSEFEDQWSKNSLNSTYQFPLVCYSNFYNTTESGSFQYGNLKLSDQNSFRNLPPAVWLREIFIQCFKDAGLNVSGDILLDSDFKDLFLPKTGKNEAFWNWGKLAYGNFYFDNNFTKKNGYRAYDNNGVLDVEFYGDFHDTKVGYVYTQNFTLSGLNYSVTMVGGLTMAVNNYLDGLSTIQDIGKIYNQVTNEITVPIDGYYDTRFSTNKYVFNESIDLSIIPVRRSAYDILGDEYLYFEKGLQSYFVVSRNLDNQNLSNEIYNWIQGGYVSLPDEVLYIVRLTDYVPNNIVYYNSNFGDFNATTDAYFTSAFTNPNQLPKDFDLIDGDKLNVSVVSIINTSYIIGDESNFKINGQLEFRPYLSTQEECILNYDTNELEPAYSEVQLAKTLPIMTQQEFIRGVINWFNLYFTYDEASNTIVFYKFKDFYKPKDFAIDITKLVEGGDFEIKPFITNKKTEISYQKDTNEAYIFYDKYEKIDTNIYSSGTVSINLPFSQTFNNTFRFYDNSIINLPHFYNSKDSVPQSQFLEKYNFDFGVRPLKYLGVDTTKYLDFYILGTANGLPMSEFPFDRLAINQIFFDNYELEEIGKERLNVKLYLNEQEYKDLRLDLLAKYKYNYYRIESIGSFSPIDFHKKSATINLVKI